MVEIKQILWDVGAGLKVKKHNVSKKHSRRILICG
jgi:hypothetical protein